MIEIIPIVDLKIIDETLSRMGIGNKKEKILYPSCYIYELNEVYYIAHFKELFQIKNGYNNLTEEDNKRMNNIVSCLSDWGLLIIKYPNEIIDKNCFVYILPFKEKWYWNIKHKITR
jgi:hypothetical protein